jgi:cytochrome c peroxidase
MKMKKSTIVIGLLLLGFTTIDEVVFIVPTKWPKPIYDFSKNPLTSSKITLGRALFYDPILSRNNTVSCASCHSQYAAFAHIDHPLSHGIDDRIGKRNAPALVNLAWQKNFMWDGAINHLDMQSLFPITHPDEMDESIERVVHKLQSSPLYPTLFKQAFNDSSVTGEHILKAISQFLVTLVSINSKYDSVMRKQATFTTAENNGYRLFKINCASCHTEPLFTNFSFENNGLQIDTILNDFGRMKVTQSNADSLRFKVPTLRNIQYSYPYMHDGRFNRLSEVLKYYTSDNKNQAASLSPLIKKINLTPNEKVDLLIFLLTLSDKSFLNNPKHAFPKDLFLKTY